MIKSILMGLGATTLVFIVTISIAFVVTQSIKLYKNMEANDARKKASGVVNSLKQRVFEEKVYSEGFVDIIVNEGGEDQFITAAKALDEKHIQRQARFFLSCALNLMAHSYGDVEEVRRVAHEIIDKELDE